MQCFGPEKKKKKKNEIRSRAGGDRHPRTLHMQHTHTLRHRGSSVLVGGLRSGPPHSTDKCLAPARPQSAFTGQQIRTGGHTPNPFTLQSVYLRVCVWGRERGKGWQRRTEIEGTQQESTREGEGEAESPPVYLWWCGDCCYLWRIIYYWVNALWMHN